MLFNFSKKRQQTDQSAVLASLNSNGVSLAINELIRYQNKASLINLGASKSLHGKMSGNYLARSKGRGMEFDEVRHYQTGDDIRAIDWRVTARTGKTHTKLFREEIERPVLIATDLTSSMFFGSQLLFKSVQSAHIAALVAWHAKARGDRLGGLVFNQFSHQELKPRSRKQGVLHYLQAMVDKHAESFEHMVSDSQNPNANDNIASCQQVFEDNCRRLRQLAKPGSLVYLITDGRHLTEESIKHLALVNQHCELIIALVSDPLEQSLPDFNARVNVEITDGANREQLTLGDSRTKLKYQQEAYKRQQHLKHLIEKSGARLLAFDAGTSLETQLKNGGHV